MKGKSMRWWILLLLAAAAAAGGWLRYRKGAKDGAMEMRSVTVKKGPIEEIVETTGEIAPLNRVEIKPAVSGRIESLRVDEGDHVKAGQIVAEMSSADRVAILDAALAQGPDVYKKWADDYKPIPIITPLAGLIILRNVVVGQMVDPTVVIYALSDKLIVIAQVDETDVGRVRMGMPARITLDAYPDRAVEGKIFDILYEGVNTNNVITYNVKIQPTKGVPTFFRSQMTANVDFVIRKKNDALLVPALAVTQVHGQNQVLVPDPDGKPTPRAVKLGIEGSSDDEIVDGLQEGDAVIIAQKRYVPQQAQTSPLALGGAKKQGQGGGGGGSH